jgi:hypothetical protein
MGLGWGACGNRSGVEAFNISDSSATCARTWGVMDVIEKTGGGGRSIGAAGTACGATRLRGLAGWLFERGGFESANGEGVGVCDGAPSDGLTLSSGGGFVASASEFDTDLVPTTRNTLTWQPLAGIGCACYLRFGLDFFYF